MAEVQTRQPVDTEATRALIAKIKKGDADERAALEANILRIAPPEAAGDGEVIFYRGQLLL
jgi:hypothetical protein